MPDRSLGFYEGKIVINTAETRRRAIEDICILHLICRIGVWVSVKSTPCGTIVLEDVCILLQMPDDRSNGFPCLP
jgi:hypothetical protein